MEVLIGSSRLVVVLAGSNRLVVVLIGSIRLVGRYQYVVVG